MSLSYLSITFGEEFISKWINELLIFRLCACYPYPADLKPERFIVKIKYNSDEELTDILGKLEIAEDKSREEEQRFQDLNENITSGYCLIAQTSCYLDINKILNTIVFEVAGTKDDPFKLNESVFNKAYKIEQFLLKQKFNYIDPPQDDRYCISPKYYPDAFNKE